MLSFSQPRSAGIKFELLWLLAKVAQKSRLRGIERLIPLVYPLEKRRDYHLEVTIEYDTNLLINIDTASFVEYSIFFYGYFEPEISGLIKRVFRPGFVAFDIGANIGCQTLIMALYAGEKGQVIAIEPHPKICARLIDNIRLNRLKNVQVLQCGLSNVTGEEILHCAPDDYPNQGVSSLYSGSVLNVEVPIQVQTLDNIMQAGTYNRLDFVKIDTQGSDYNILLGAIQSIGIYKPYLLFEYEVNEWTRAKADFSVCDDLLTRQGYTLYVLRRRGLDKVKNGLPHFANILAVPPFV
jgi:FkbM family methyltransferase